MDQKVWRDRDSYPHHSIFYLDFLIDHRDINKAEEARKAHIKSKTLRNKAKKRKGLEN